MSLFTNLSILRKLVSTFSLLLLLTAGLGAFALTRVSFVTQVADGLEANIAGTTPIQVMAQCGYRLFGFAAENALATSASQLAALARQEDGVRKTFAADWPVYQPTMDPGRESQDGNGFHSAFDAMSRDAAEVARDVGAGNRAAAVAMVTGPMAALSETFSRQAVDDLGYQGEMAAGHAASITAARRASQSGIAVALLAIMLTVAGLVWLLIADIGRPIGAMTQTMRRLAEGDLDAPVADAGRRDEIGAMARAVEFFKKAGLEKARLAAEFENARRRGDAERQLREAERDETARQQAAMVEAIAIGLEKLSEGDLVFRLTTSFSPGQEKLRTDFNSAMERLQTAMKVIAGNTAGLRSGIGEISSAADDLSRRTERQAARLEETVAALDGVAITVRETAEGATQAGVVIGTAQTDAERSGDVVQRAVAAMGAIETSSRQIGNIIGAIDEIAFQTNLLALNAGVEAARAGDSGRGFAVVASEVRALAQRSAEAAKEIKALISTSTRQVVTGVDLVGQAGTALTRIVGKIGEINAIVAKITASAQAQAKGLQEVNAAVNQMDSVTRQNAAMVEHSTAATHALAAETEQLARLTARFRVGPLEAPGDLPGQPVSRRGRAYERASA